MAKSPKPGSVENRKAHWIEWATGAVSSLLVMTLVGWIAYEAATQDDGPPDLSVTIVNSVGRAGGYLVMFDVNNAADRTAAAVVVRGEITDQNTLIETVETTLDYVPARSTARGGLIFRNDPAGRSRLFATGFSEP
ncbi:TIGR02588 family protein (plasmid) [Ensifer sp. PDNC004]|nr:TIGR02588 family protein [Ensifer sp. PDNC004]QRY70728.1 TIGR02588 family protein [Ensifer sp. PDNC004]